MEEWFLWRGWEGKDFPQYPLVPFARWTVLESEKLAEQLVEQLLKLNRAEETHVDSKGVHFETLVFLWWAATASLHHLVRAPDSTLQSFHIYFQNEVRRRYLPVVLLPMFENVARARYATYDKWEEGFARSISEGDPPGKVYGELGDLFLSHMFDDTSGFMPTLVGLTLSRMQLAQGRFLKKLKNMFNTFEPSASQGK